MMGTNNRPYSRSQRGCSGTLDGGGKSWSALKTRRIPQAERRRKGTLVEEDRLIKGSLATEACVDACVHFLRLLEQMITNSIQRNRHSFFYPSRSQNYDVSTREPKARGPDSSRSSKGEIISCFFLFLMAVRVLGLWLHPSSLCLHLHLVFSSRSLYNLPLPLSYKDTCDCI